MVEISCFYKTQIEENIARMISERDSTISSSVFQVELIEKAKKMFIKFLRKHSSKHYGKNCALRDTIAWAQKKIDKKFKKRLFNFKNFNLRIGVGIWIISFMIGCYFI